MGRTNLRHLIFTFILFSITTVAETRTGFIFFGDWGMGNEGQKRVARAMQTYCRTELCEFGLTLGDNFYPGVRSVDDPKWKARFADIYGPLGFPFHPSLGNHDYEGIVQSQIDYSAHSQIWKMPARYYKLSKPLVDFFALDTDPPQFDRAQEPWLRDGLKDSQAHWKIVYGHHPIYSYGMHGNTRIMIERILPIVKGKAHFYICGHEHDKQILTGPDKLSLIVAGTAAEGRPSKTGPQSLYASSVLGFGHMLLTHDTARMRFINAEGKVEHEYEVKHFALNK